MVENPGNGVCCHRASDQVERGSKSVVETMRPWLCIKLHERCTVRDVLRGPYALPKQTPERTETKLSWSATSTESHGAG